ncbi:hypothetical protein [Lichenibacterium dinghuense]|uniref:hypothetical protein n=1 Tax=Lichenibacterium dinghuense TaxID=2895977 RepID=UPI001F464F1A|nr:hypothetical protein [Lichenibacterium sp. 6Y81]
MNNFETNAGTFRGASRPTGAPPRPEMARRVMDIEDVLRWAFRDELPKDRQEGGEHGPGGYKCPLGAMGLLGTVVDNWSREPGFPAALGGPHPDALRVEAAVARLAELADQPIGAAPDLVPDFGAIGSLDEVAAVRRALGMMPGLVARCARMGRRLPWRATTYPERIETANGRTMVAQWKTVASGTCDGREVDQQELVPVSASGGKDTYPLDSFCPLVFEPSLQSIAEERAEYLVWWGALDHLALDLMGELDTIAVLPPMAPQRPWVENTELGAAPRVFADLRRTYRVETREADEARATAAAHRMLGQRRLNGGRAAVARSMIPRRTVPAVARRARA